MEETRYIHKFQEAGLGIAPFSLHDVTWSDAWASCQFCGTAIKERCWIKDTNGKIFLVGNECVKYTGDRGLIDVVQRAVNALRTQRRHEREEKQIWVGRTILFHSKEVREAYKAQKRIYKDEWFDGYILGTLMYGGNKYKLDIAKAVRKIADELLSKETIEWILNNQESLIASIEAEKTRIREEKEAEEKRKLAEWNAEAAAKRERATKENEEILNILHAMNPSSFVSSMIGSLKVMRLNKFSPRQLEVLTDIYGKNFGNRNTKEYKEAVERFEQKIEQVRQDV